MLDRSEQWSGDTVEPQVSVRPSTPPQRLTERKPRRAAFNGPVDNAVRGIARAVEHRTVSNRLGSQAQTPREVLVFRVERYDSAGNRLSPVPVELRSSVFEGHISGQVREGDEVAVTGAWRRGTLRAETLFNVSTGAHVSGLPEGGRGKRMILILTALAAFFVVPIVGFAIFAQVADDQFQRDTERRHEQFQRDSEQQRKDFEESARRNEEAAHREYCESLQRNGFRLDADCRSILGVP